MSELDHMDALAAEYVLGSLDVEERAQARNLLEADPTFAAKVELWERRFGELHLMVEPVEPDSGIWARIKAKLPEVQQGIRPPEPSMPPSVPPASPSPAAAAPQPARDQALERTTALVRRRLRRWRAFAILMTLVVAAIGALLAAWRFAPDRVPPSLQPLELMRYVGVALPTGPAQRRPAPPESRFDE